jgi:predicted secreted Zn-dependent protease
MNQTYNLVICTHTMLCLSRSEDGVTSEIKTHRNNFTAGVRIREINHGAVKKKHSNEQVKAV